MFVFQVKFLAVLFTFLNINSIYCSITDGFEIFGTFTNELNVRKTYLYQNQKLSWQNAQNVCFEADLEPLNFQSKLEKTVFSVALRQSDSHQHYDTWHIGGKKSMDDWTWIQENNQLSNITFDINLPVESDDSDSNCLGIMKNKIIGLTFKAVNCDNETVGFFCQKIDGLQQSWFEKSLESLQNSHVAVKKFFTNLDESLRFHTKNDKNKFQ